VVIDGIAVYDDRALHSFDNNPDPYFASPGPFGTVRVEGSTVLTEETLASLTGTATLAGGDATNFEISVSPDDGATYFSATDTNTVTQNLGTPADRANLRLGLSGTGTQSSSPSEAVTAHAVTATTLTADTTGTPRLTNSSFDGDALGVLREIADRTGAIWEVQWDESAGQQELNWTQPGQRPQLETLDPSTIVVERDARTIVEAATVLGGRRRRDVESASASFDSLFRVTIQSTNEPVAEGNTLDVTAEVENIGNASGSQTVTLDVAGAQRDSQTVTLDAQETTTITLSWTTSQGDAGTYTATVDVGDDTDGVAVEIVDAAVFDVSIQSTDVETPPASLDPAFVVTSLSTNSPITEGETLFVDATIENIGADVGFSIPTLEIDGTTEDSTSVQLVSGGVQTVTLQWSTTSGEVGPHEARVETTEDSKVTGARVT
jgi:hypothetical protein